MTTVAPPPPTLPPIESLTTETAFFSAVNTLFETAPPLAKRLFQAGPFRSYGALIDKAEEIISALNESDRTEVINAHPRIGLNPQQQQVTISALSYREQGLDKDAQQDPQVVAEVFRQLKELNEQYEAKFGFKFVVFVAGRPKAAIIPVLKERLQSTRDKELALGLSEMIAIARDRLKKLEPQQQPTTDSKL